MDIDLPERYAVIYGVADYGDPQNNLEYTDDDALDMEKLLLSKGFQVYRRIDEEATLTNLENDIQEIKATAGKDSLFLFYFSGHGGQDIDIQRALQFSEFSITKSAFEPLGMDNDDEWIFLRGSLPISEENLALTINDDDLRNLLKDIPSRMKVVIIDACNSGGFIGKTPYVDMIPQNFVGEPYGRGPDNFLKALYLYREYDQLQDSDLPFSEVVVLSAAGEQEFSYEYFDSGDPQNGVFTNFFLETPAHGDLNGDGFITVTEAYTYTFDKINETWNRNYQAAYNFLPRITGNSLDYVLFEAD